MGSSSADFVFKPFSDFFPFFAEASSSVKVGKFCLFGVDGKGLDPATTGDEPREGIVRAFLTIRSGEESGRLLLSLILSSRIRDGVVGTGGRGKVEGVAGKEEDFTCPPKTLVTGGEEEGPTGLSIGDAMKGIGSGLCLSEEMGFAFGVEVII